MKNLTITFSDPIATEIVRHLAEAYAAASIKRHLPHDTVNAPWSWSKAQHPSWRAAWRAFIVRNDQRAIALRKTLNGFVANLPDPPKVEWRPYTHPTSGKVYACFYAGSKTIAAAKDYADLVIAAVEAQQSASVAA